MADRYFCSSTRLRLRGPRQIIPFLRSSALATMAARGTPGNVRTKLLGLPPFPIYYTITVWESEEAMRAFVKTERHREAMAHMDRFAKVGSFARFTSDTPRVSWRRAFRELRTPAGVHVSQPPAPRAAKA